MTNRAAVEYEMNGKRYGFDIPAESWQEAEERLRAIRTTAKVSGWPCFSVRVNSVTLPFATVWLSIRAWLWGLFGKASK